MFLDADGRVPTKYWLIDPTTGQIVDHGDRPAGRAGTIACDDIEPRVLICAETASPALVGRP